MDVCGVGILTNVRTLPAIFARPQIAPPLRNLLIRHLVPGREYGRRCQVESMASAVRRRAIRCLRAICWPIRKITASVVLEAEAERAAARPFLGLSRSRRQTMQLWDPRIYAP